MTRRRSGWVVLFAVAAAILGGAFAVRLKKKRKQPASPEPLEPQPRPAPAPPRSDAERSLLRMAIGGAVFVLLAIAAVVLTAPGGDRAVTPHLVTTRSAGPNGEYTQVFVPAPVDRDQRVALRGDFGDRVEIGIRAIASTEPYLDQQNYMVIAHMRNTGEGWIGTRLDRDASVFDAAGMSYPANQMLSLDGAPDGSTDPTANPAWQLEPGAEVDRHLVFTVPLGTQPTRLRLVVTMVDGTTRTAEWNL